MTYTAVNDNPIINSSAFSADENQTAIGALDVSDVDGDSLIIPLLVLMLTSYQLIMLLGY